ncbi:hypothetical protein Ancab_036012 [Ancistrocladus abbreviatus]
MPFLAEEHASVHATSPVKINESVLIKVDDAIFRVIVREENPARGHSSWAGVKSYPGQGPKLFIAPKPVLEDGLIQQNFENQEEISAGDLVDQNPSNRALSTLLRRRRRKENQNQRKPEGVQ